MSSHIYNPQFNAYPPAVHGLNNLTYPKRRYFLVDPNAQRAVSRSTRILMIMFGMLLLFFVGSVMYFAISTLIRITSLDYYPPRYKSRSNFEDLYPDY